MQSAHLQERRLQQDDLRELPRVLLLDLQRHHPRLRPLRGSHVRFETFFCFVGRFASSRQRGGSLSVAVGALCAGALEQVFLL
jgi:hypothetical protein